MEYRALQNPCAVTFLAAEGWLGIVGSSEAPVTFLAAEGWLGIVGSSEAPAGEPLVVGST
jgi:hypothetical protein